MSTKSAAIAKESVTLTIGFDYGAILAEHREQLRSGAQVIRASLIAATNSLMND